MQYWHGLDWKVLLFAALGCFVLPWLLIAFVVSAVFPMLSDGGRNLLMNIVLPSHYLVLPFLAGYFTAKYANNRPQLHVFLVTVVGYLFLLRLTFQGEPIWGHIIKVAALVATASLGAFIVLRGRRHEI